MTDHTIIQKPQSTLQHQRALWKATFLITIFYFYALLCLVLIGIATTICALLVILGTSGTAPGVRLFGPATQTLWGIAKAIARSLNLQRGVHYQIVLQREEAENLFELVESTARRLNVAAPEEIVLEPAYSAWVQLKGYRKGHGKSRLGLGLSCLAALERVQVEAIIAHEMAHAKLVQRGYRGWLLGGLGRLSQLVRVLEVPISSHNTSKKFNWAATLRNSLVWFPDILGKHSARLAGMISRNDEFEADRVASELCSVATYRKTLIDIHVLSRKDDTIMWHERLAHVQQGNYFNWLQAHLKPRDDNERRELEEDAMVYQLRSEFGSHPVLADRLTFLEHLKNRTASASTHLSVKSAALLDIEKRDNVVTRLFDSIERLAQSQEKKLATRSQQHIRKANQKARNKERATGVGILLIGLICLYFSVIWIFVDESLRNVLTSTLLIGIISGIAMIYGGFNRVLQYTGTTSLELPIPSLSSWEKAQEARFKTPENQREEEVTSNGGLYESDWHVVLSKELRAQTPNIHSRRFLRQYWQEQCYEALSRCDYQRAKIASHLCLEIDYKHPESVIGHCISSAYFASNALSRDALGAPIQRYGVGPTVSWAVAWVDCLIGKWNSAEAYLLDTISYRPNEATLWALLGQAQWHTGKPRESLESFNRALSLSSQSSGSRLWRARAALKMGNLALAEEDLTWLQRQVKEQETIAVSMTHLSLLVAQNRQQDALAKVDTLCDAHAESSTRMSIAQTLSDSQSEILRQRAALIYENIQNESFHPQACLRLSYLAFERRDFNVAKYWALQALNMTQERGKDVPHPLQFLQDVCNALRAINKVAERCTLWNVELELLHTHIEIKELSLLVAHSSRETAEQMVHEIYTALYPLACDTNKTPATWSLCAANEQPQEPVVPAIYRVKVLKK